VTPDPVDATYPVLLADLPAPRLLTYPVYTVVAEKLHAIALLGMTNCRWGDGARPIPSATQTSNPTRLIRPQVSAGAPRNTREQAR